MQRVKDRINMLKGLLPPLPFAVRKYEQDIEIKDQDSVYFEIWSTSYYLSELGVKLRNALELRLRTISSTEPIIKWHRAITLVPEVKQELRIISSYKRAVQEGVAKSYFGEADWLQLSEGESDKFIYQYSGDYDQFLEDCDQVKKNEAYERHCKKNAKKTEISEISYDLEISDFYVHSEKQKAVYYDVLSNFDKVAIASDGLGVASLLCAKMGIDYVSWEPKAIGEKARSIGLIHSKKPIYDSSRIYFYFHCHKYYKLPSFPRQKYIIVDVPGSDMPGKLLYNGITTNFDWTFKHNYRHKNKGFSLETYYPLDKDSDNYCKTLGARRKSLEECQYIVFSIKMSLENCRGTVIWTLYSNKVVYLPQNCFPFRKNRHRYGALIVQGNEVYHSYGKGLYPDASSIITGDDYISNGVIISDYTILENYVIIRHSKPEIVRAIKLKEEDQHLSDNATLGVLYIRTQVYEGVRCGVYSMVTRALKLQSNVEVSQWESRVPETVKKKEKHKVKV